MKSLIMSDALIVTMSPIFNGFREIFTRIHFPRRKKKQIKIQIYDDSKRGEVTYVIINQTKIAFPAHSSHAIRYLIDTFCDTLGYQYTIRKCEDNVWEITIKEQK